MSKIIDGDIAANAQHINEQDQQVSIQKVNYILVLNQATVSFILSTI